MQAYDDADARWQPVSGCDLETYARISATLLKRGVAGPEIGRLATAEGISPSGWSEARTEWMRRITEFEDVRASYASLYRAFTVRGVGS